MIKVGKKLIKNKEFFYTYSDSRKMIKDAEGNYYNSAYDVVKREYEETDIDVPIQKTESENKKYE